jgi:hypothetical protein
MGARETITGAKKDITHYDDAGEAVAWTCEGAEKAETCESGGKWMRNISGVSECLKGKGNTSAIDGLCVHTRILATQFSVPRASGEPLPTDDNSCMLIERDGAGNRAGACCSSRYWVRCKQCRFRQWRDRARHKGASYRLRSRGQPASFRLAQLESFLKRTRNPPNTAWC